MGILDGLLGEQVSVATGLHQHISGLDYRSFAQQGMDCNPNPDYYGFQNMANQRLGNGIEPIDWPQIIVNQCRALALTRPLTQIEQFTYAGALQALNKIKE